MLSFTSRTIHEILFLFFCLWAFVRTSSIEVSSLKTSLEANSIKLVHNNRKLKQQREANDACHNKALLWHICYYEDCSLTIASEVFSTVRQRPCTFNMDTRLWDCIDLSVDERSYEALKFGECQATCFQQQVSCRVLPRIESINGVRIPSQSCPSGQFPTQYNCNCQILNYSEMIAYTQRILGPHGGCTPVCYESDKSLSDCATTDRPNLSLGSTNTSQHSCGTFICTLQGCGAIVTSAARSVISSETCTFTQASRLWDCGGVLEMDEPGYTWATQGTCISACDVTVASNACVFTVRYGKYPTQWDVPEETEVDKASREKALSIKTQNKTLSNSNTTIEEGDDLEEGKIRSSEAVSSLASEDLEEEEEVSTGKVSSRIEKEPVIEEEEVDSDLTTAVKREKDSNSKLPRSSSSRTRLRNPPSPSPSPNRGKVMRSSTPNTPTPTFANVPNTPLTGDSPRSQELPRSVVSPSPMEPFPDPPSFANELPPLPPPVGVRTRLIEVSIESSEGGTSSSEGEVYLGPWLPCPQVCNFSAIEVSHRERFILCRSKVTGIALPSSYCSDLETPNITSFEECPTSEDSSICQRQYLIKFHAWSACTQSCTSDQEEGTRERDFECYERLGNHSLVLVPKSSCAPDRSSLTRTCVARPCNPVVYRTTDWNTCNCNSRTQTRNVSCVRIEPPRSNTNSTLCELRGLILPRTRQNCTCDRRRGPGRLLLQGNDPCAGNNCSGHGTCQNGSCICEEGFVGLLCDQIEHLGSWNDSCSQNDSSTDCCESGISDSSFICCSIGSTLDRNGACCDGQVDVCGECNGPAKFVDALGKCCSTTLDAAGVCCESGEVDECGVCDGLGMSCDFRIVFKINSNFNNSCVPDLVSQTLPFTSDTAEPEIRHAIEEYSLIVFIPGSFLSIGRSVKLVEQLIRDKLPDVASNSCEDNVLGLEAVEREHVLGNHLCEIGETVFINSRTFTGFFQDSASWSGAQDCPFVIASCPLPRNTSRVGEIDKPCSQRGSCSFAGEAQCHCFRGYLGEACDQCEPGYTPRNGLCIRTRLNTYEVGTNEEDLSEVQEKDSEGERRQFVFIAVTVIAVVLGVIFSLSCVVYLTFHGRDNGPFRRDNNPPNGLGNWAHFSVGTSRTSRLFYGPLKSTSSSSVSGRVSLKTEPSMMPPFDRKSPPPLDCTSPPSHEGQDSNSPHSVPAPNPFLPSSSSQPATFYPVNSFTNTTVDVEGNAQKTQRMPSFDDNHLKGVQARPTERQAASFGKLDSIELVSCPPSDMSIEEGKVRRHSGTAMATHSTRQFVNFTDTQEEDKTVQYFLPDHGSIASLKEYAKRSSIDEKTVSSKGGQGSSRMIDMESTNAFEFAPPMLQEGQPTHHPSASDPSGRFMSYLETPSSSQRLHRMLFRSSESPAGSTSTPPTGNRFYSQNNEVIKEKERWLRKSGEGY